MKERVPVTILTGFLGAGKTTLLNRILREPHGQRIAVIENEFGPEGIDSEILVREADEEIVQMDNGCVCCSIRGDLVRTLSSLQARRINGSISFDRLVIETTGLADPGPAVQTFLLDHDAARDYALDGVITVVDALHGSDTLDRQCEAQAQVGFADRVLLSKTDLADRDSVAALTGRLQRINPRAPIARMEFGRAPIAELLSIGGFDLRSAAANDPSFLAGEHRHGADDADHRHDAIASFVFSADGSLDGTALEQLLAALAEGYGADLMRYKGIISVRGIDRRVILQGVQLVAGSQAGRPWASGEQRRSKIVFIGRDLDEAAILDSLERCRVHGGFDAPS